MTNAHARTLFLGLVFLAALVGCGDSDDGPRPERTHWSAAPAEPADRMDHSRKEYVRFVLPEAWNVRLDRPGPLPRIVVNLGRDGDVLLKGHVWLLGTGVEEERRESLAGLNGQITNLHAPPEFRTQDGMSRLSFLLHAEREARWRDVRSVLRALVHEGEPQARRLQWAVYGPIRGRDVLHEARVTPTDPENVPSEIPVVRIDAFNTADGAVLLSIGDQDWSFDPSSTPFEDPGFLERANRSWRAVHAHLATAVGDRTTAAIQTSNKSDLVPWVYIVKIVDLLMECGVFTVYVPEVELRLDLEKPERIPPEPQAPAPQPKAKVEAREDTEPLLERLEDAVKSKSAPNVEMLVALDAAARAHRRLRDKADDDEPRKVRRDRERFLKSSEKLFVKALKLQKVDKVTRRNERDEVNVRAAQILGDTGNPKLERDVRKALEKEFFKAKYDVPIQVIEEAFNALGRLGDPDSLEWMADEFIHTNESEADRLVAAHRAMVLFEDVEGKLRHAIVEKMAKTYYSLEALAIQDSSGAGFQAARDLWSRIDEGAIRVVQIFAGHPRGEDGEALATMEELRMWFRDHKRRDRPPWTDD